MGRGCQPFSDQLGAFLGVDLQAGQEGMARAWRQFVPQQKN